MKASRPLLGDVELGGTKCVCAHALALAADTV
jgi:hypothetical protein